jgi:hypothetical protein
VLETGTPGLTRRGLETGSWRSYTGTKLETAETAKGSLPVPRQSSTLLTRRGLETGPWRTYTGTKLETAETAKGRLPVPRQSSTLPFGGRRLRV